MPKVSSDTSSAYVTRQVYSFGDSGDQRLAPGISISKARSAPPDYLYPEHAEYNAILEARRGDPCVFFSDDHFEPLTEDLNQLLIFDAFYVTDERSLDGMLAYIGDADEAVVYIDTSVFWSSVTEIP